MIYCYDVYNPIYPRASDNILTNPNCGTNKSYNYKSLKQF